MTKDEKSNLPQTDALIDTSLRKQLKAIEQEDAPERLLILAKELQRLLRESNQ
jgi:hypothetical protein